LPGHATCGVPENQNMTSRSSITALTFLLTIAAATVGCGPAVRNITIRSEASLTADASSATLVIMQPSTHFGSVNILDAQGHLLGQISDRSHTVLHVNPGEVRLYAIPERQGSWGDRIVGTVEAGRVYYATIGMRWGGLTFLALNPRSADERWSHRDEFLANTPSVAMDPDQVALAVSEIGDAASLIEQVDHTVDRMDEAHLAERTILPGDGI